MIMVILGLSLIIRYCSQQKTVVGEGHVSNTIESFARKLNASIVFYGHVENDMGKSVSGAKINYSIRSPRVLSAGLASSDKSGSVMTDKNGNFDIFGNGDLLTIKSIEKAGFRRSDRDRHNFSYASSPEIHKPNIKDRVGFYLFNRSNNMNDVKSAPEGKLKLTWDGVTIKMDMKTCTISPQGELTITAKRSGRNFEISMQLDSGLLHDGHGANRNLAPESGYSGIWNVSYTEGKPYAWMGTSPFVFYKKDGIYGRLTLERIFSESPPDEVGIYITHTYNQAGRRDLASAGAD